VEAHKFPLLEDNALSKSLSIRIAEYPQAGDTFNKASKFADVVRYQAKRGRNRTARFQPEMLVEDQYRSGAATVNAAAEILPKW
jgi:hypothetical protein